MRLDIDEALQEKFPDLTVLVEKISGVKIAAKEKSLDDFKNDVVHEVTKRYSLEALKDVKVFRAYRDFFWRVGIDPTKVRPASEALIRRVLAGKPLPTINTFVDAYNLASINSEIALAAFDAKMLDGSLLLRLAKAGEEFWGIGMEKPIVLNGNEVVISDESKLVAVYPYRDADSTKITLDTTEALVLSCGVPSIEGEKLESAIQIVLDYINRFCGGRRQ